ncbi:hypothetical protein E2C01_063064 [Portunus trituberculatus]|uniref:Uncharacterized protein n=1 Tax=Portunus trituberculatus TaxID=210409 RepID=A0A5B7HJT6_PORTR|nr:hypothetical protein [Portunus trituberculatus]
MVAGVGVGVGVGVKEPELVGSGVVMGGPAPVLSHLDHPGFEGVGGGAVGGMGGPAGMLDPSMGGAGGPFSSPAGPDYNSMAASIPMDSPTPLLPTGHGGPQPQNFTDTQVSPCVSLSSLRLSLGVSVPLGHLTTVLVTHPITVYILCLHFITIS